MAINSKLNVERREEIIHLREIGYTLKEIGDDFGISRQRVYQILGDVSLRSARRKINSKSARQYLLARLGGVCIKCGFSDWRALQIDHINGGGRQEHKQKNYSIYREMANMPEKEFKLKYQLLCANCNWIKRYVNNEVANGKEL